MTLIVADRVLETTTTTGTGAIALAAAKAGFRRFSTVCTTGDTCYYAIQSEDTGGTATGEWETGLGTYSSANTLTRTTVHASSNAGSAVNFGAGTKSVWIDITASQFSGHTHNYIPTAEKGAANGVAPLGTDQKIAATYLPSYVDDVVEVANYAALPGTGETGKIYTALDNNKIYRWSGSAYVEISPSPGSTDSVTEGSSNLYHTAARVRDAVLTGLSTATNAVIAATDSVLVAFGKLQAQISSLVSGKQDSLVSGTNIKTINGASILGAGNMAIDSGGMTLLGTLTTTSGSSQTLSGLDLSTYKMLAVSVLDVGLNAAGTISIGSGTLYSVTSGTNNLNGTVFVDLATGYFSGVIQHGSSPTARSAATGITTASTSVSFTSGSNTFDSGTIKVYGMK